MDLNIAMIYKFFYKNDTIITKKQRFPGKRWEQHFLLTLWKICFY